MAALASRAFASSTSTFPRNRWESLRSWCHGRCHSSLPGKRSKSRSGMPSASILSAGVPSSFGTQSPVRKVRSPSMKTPQPAS